MNVMRKAFVMGALAWAAEGAAMERDGARDFDFWMGSWTVHNRRLRERLAGSTTWDEFEATTSARMLLGGVGNEDVYRTGFAGGFTGMSFRFYDNSTGKWSIYWADSRRGVLDPPVVGSFQGDVGTFEGDDQWEGRPVRVRFIWSRTSTPSPRWEQAFSEDGGRTWETNWIMDMTRSGDVTSEEFPVVELRRYETKSGERARFAACFDAYFPEAFQQVGGIVFGQGSERRNENGFTWLRGFPTYAARAEGMWGLYNGPVWKEQAARMNDRLEDAANVLFLRPFAAGRGLRVLPAVDAAGERAGGIIVIQILAVKDGQTDAVAARAEESFAAYRAAGAREGGVLVTLDRPNNFPRHVMRTDGPLLVWVGVVKDEAALQGLRPLAERAARRLGESGGLREEPELVVIEPSPRSRLRWTSR